MQREARKDLAIGSATQTLHEITLLRDLVRIADDPFECAELHRGERIFDRGQRLAAIQPPAYARPESVARGRGERKWFALQLGRASISRRCVMMQSIEIRIED